MDNLRKETKETEFTRVVVGVIFNIQADSILVAQRLDGAFEFIGGKTLKQKGTTLESELIELVDKQIGPLGVKPGELLGRARQHDGDGVNEVFYIKCVIPYLKDPEINRELHSKLLWVKRKDLAGLDWGERDREFAVRFGTATKAR